MSLWKKSDGSARFPFVDLMATQLSNYIDGGEIVTRTAISPEGVKVQPSRISSTKYDKGVINIFLFPTGYKRNLYEDLHLISSQFEGSEISLCVASTPERNPVGHKNFVFEMESAARIREELERIYYQDSNRAQKMFGKVMMAARQKIVITKKTLQNAQRKDDSYTYVYQKHNEGSGLFQSIVSIEYTVRGDNLYDKNGKKISRESIFLKLEQQIMGYLNQRGFVARPLRGKLPKYLRDLSPIGNIKFDAKSKVHYGLNLLASENYSKILPNKVHGITGDGFGYCFGVDIESRHPATFNLKNTPDGAGIMVCGETGSGKTFMVENILDSILINNDHVSFYDVKGNEGKQYAEHIGMGTVIDIGPSGRFPNMFDISGLNLDVQSGKEYYDHVKEGVISLVKVLCNTSEVRAVETVQTDNLIEAITPQAVDKTFLKYGVYRDKPNSFKNCELSMYRDFYQIMVSLLRSHTLTEKQQDYGADILSNIRDFFNSEGKYTGMLENTIKLSEILEERLVIYSLGMSVKASSSVYNAVKFFIILHFDKFKHMHRRRMNKFTTVVMEEVQVFAKFASIREYIAGIFTMSRGANVIPIMILNSLSIFDEQEGAKEFRDIAGNMSHLLIGATNKDNIRILEKMFKSDDIIQMVKDVSSVKDETINGKPLTPREKEFLYRAFAFSYKEGNTVKKLFVRAEVPKEFVQARQTRTTVTDYKRKVDN